MGAGGLAIVEAVAGRLDVVMVGRLALTLVLCGLVGIERSTHDRATGLRPHILVGIGACLMTMAGAYGFPDVPTATRDPLRVASYVVSGIGFLGAGAILRHGATVRGLTTAGSLWGAAGIGLAVGVGVGALAAVAVALLVFTLGPLQRLEARLRWGRTPRRLVLHLVDDDQSVGKTLAALDRLGLLIRRATVDLGEGEGAVLRVDLVRALSPDDEALLVKRLLTLKHVSRVESFGEDRSVDDAAPPTGGAESGFTPDAPPPAVATLEPSAAEPLDGPFDRGAARGKKRRRDGDRTGR
jgi:putative Mg2+ transporter-C (MgtC) family protein